MKQIVTIFSLIIIFTACHSKTDKEMFDAAQQKDNAKNYSEAVKDYQKLADEYPESELTCKGLFKIAAMYQAAAVPNISKDESLKKSIEFYKKVYDQFPKSDEAPKALFMCGFIQANELKQMDAAKSTYQEFLKKFPTHEMAASAKLEIDNLGATPEDILKKNSEKTK